MSTRISETVRGEWEAIWLSLMRVLPSALGESEPATTQGAEACGLAEDQVPRSTALPRDTTLPAGCAPQDRAGAPGHSGVGITGDTYVHSVRARQRQAVSALNDRLFGEANRRG